MLLASPEAWMEEARTASVYKRKREGWMKRKRRVDGGREGSAYGNQFCPVPAALQCHQYNELVLPADDR